MPGTSAYATGDDDTARSASTNVRVLATGAIGSRAPCTTSVGGAAAVRWSPGAEGIPLVGAGP